MFFFTTNLSMHQKQQIPVVYMQECIYNYRVYLCVYIRYIYKIQKRLSTQRLNTNHSII